MWPRIIRLLAAVFNMYSFYANPLRYILSLLMVLVIPYLIYIFWGSLLVLALIAAGIYFVYKALTNTKKSNIRA